jgi:citronellol/citronellal dehydrogenase
MEARWFAPHVAYTMAKFGMSLCVLGMAAEFKDQGVACNALWPRTTIATAAIRNVLGGEAVVRLSRTPDIVADAAHLVFAQPAARFTGNFLIDDSFLYETGGVTDFAGYSVVPGATLAPDFFVPAESPPPPGVTVAANLKLS